MELKNPGWKANEALKTFKLKLVQLPSVFASTEERRQTVVKRAEHPILRKQNQFFSQVASTNYS